ncbi:XRE family transcriptional regulator [Geotoga petraea]|uniref:SOS-response transcriptional repressor LexA (RecA-mediated autopeptidase) n=1 Tax=Geotoga petraea TaxID=28234 RepID=A0A1G6LQT3_9BACT|nr:XRE family transcriptional regulator [Geotoga petraea]SDC45105.1 SOS-response transcriptional repressor LexA (RecA-mediated autopeptidase) [Geotoga petraea]
MRLRTDRLLLSMTKKGISQTELAKIIGVSKSQISRYKNGYDSPSNENIRKLAKALNTTVEYLTGYDESKVAKVGNVSFYEKPVIKGVYFENGMLQLNEIRKITLPDIEGCDFIVAVSNNEMAPKIKESDLALFTSTKNFKKNDIVYVYLDNEAKIRRALPINDKEVLFQTIDTEKQDISKDYKIIGRFIGVIRMES